MNESLILRLDFTSPLPDIDLARQHTLGVQLPEGDAREELGQHEQVQNERHGQQRVLAGVVDGDGIVMLTNLDLVFHSSYSMIVDACLQELQQ
ncbi:unnamed protein product [Leptidea sinapis]|uniref:Uncharacterized protein n=1 Tax=Leptidea sinapis TaxID=189913 RepID=A0A5E4QJ13_9NEOP|nr:unnamed protein product [Leptidea sinapis]